MAASLLFSSSVSSSSPHLLAFAPPYYHSSRSRTIAYDRTLGAAPPTPSTTPPTKTTSPEKTANLTPPPPPPPAGSPLMEVVDSQHKFELNLGRAVDALKNDYPNLLTKNPNWKIYHSQLEVIDPTGVTMRGLENYKVAFSFVHAVVRWFYCESRSGMTRCRVGYDWARRCIRVSWNVEIVPKMIYGGTRNTLHVDGISEYHLDRDSGLITEHRVTHLLINDQAVRPANGIFNALKEFAGTGGKPYQ